MPVETIGPGNEQKKPRPLKAVRIPKEGETEDQILRLPQIIELTALSRAEIYRRINSGAFPRPLKIGKRATGWRWGTVRLHVAAIGRVS
jgi:prophage regulatory protein